MPGRGSTFESIQPGNPEEDGLVWGVWGRGNWAFLLLFFFLNKTLQEQSFPGDAGLSRPHADPKPG